MYNFLLSLFREYPWTLYIFVSLVIFGIFVIVYVILKGRGFSIGWFKIGETSDIKQEHPQQNRHHVLSQVVS